jgi:hypothetical protein
MRLSADGSLLAVVHGGAGPTNYQGTVTVWDVAQSKQKWPPIKPNLTYLITCGFSENGRFLACSGSGGTDVFDMLTTQLQPAPRGDLVRSVALNGDGRLLALATLQSQAVVLWDHALHREMAALRLPDPAREVVLSADGQTLVALLDQSIQIWGLAGTGEKRDPPDTRSASLSWPSVPTANAWLQRATTASSGSLTLRTPASSRNSLSWEAHKRSPGVPAVAIWPQAL